MCLADHNLSYECNKTIRFHCCEQLFFHISFCGLFCYFTHNYQHAYSMFNQQMLSMMKNANYALFKPIYCVETLWKNSCSSIRYTQDQHILIPHKFIHGFSTDCNLLITVENHKLSLYQYVFLCLCCGENCYIEIRCGNPVFIFVK